MPKIIDEEKVFSAVVNRLVSYGYEGATTKEIAAIAEVNEATLFRKYGSKAGLIEKAIEYQLSDTPLNKLAYTGELEIDLLCIVQAYLETNQLHGELIPILLVGAPHNPELKKSALKLWENLQTITGILTEYQEQGKLKTEPVMTSVNILLGPLMTNQMIRRANLGLPVPEINAQEYVATFLTGRGL